MCGMKLLIHSETSTVQLLKFVENVVYKYHIPIVGTSDDLIKHDIRHPNQNSHKDNIWGLNRDYWRKESRQYLWNTKFIQINVWYYTKPCTLKAN